MLLEEDVFDFEEHSLDESEFQLFLRWARNRQGRQRFCGDASLQVVKRWPPTCQVSSSKFWISLNKINKSRKRIE